MSIEINKETDHFFISINKSSMHSFVMLGVYDGNQVKHPLCRVGMAAVHEAVCDGYVVALVSRYIYQFFFSKAKAELKDEKVVRNKIGSYLINYQAYDITYKQYIEFIKILETIQTEKNKFCCFKPIVEEGNEVILSYTNSPMQSDSPPPNTVHLKERLANLSVRNTCRHSAVALIEEAGKTPISSTVSNSFYRNLLCQTKLEYGVPSKAIPFYVLPVPPAAYPGLNKATKKIIDTLYKRMENLLKIEANSEETQKKFACLKQLYVQTIGPQQEQTLDELLHSIQTWKLENQSTLASLRKIYFWDRFITRKSATMSEVDKLIDDLKETQNSNNKL
ncbi:MAG: hypothetical protein P4L65_10625 [Legionella sp.]|nr:hypothetical protein [Legionella sp.]